MNTFDANDSNVGYPHITHIYIYILIFLSRLTPVLAPEPLSEIRHIKPWEGTFFVLGRQIRQESGVLTGLGEEQERGVCCHNG